MQFRGKRVSVLGAGRSGLAVARLLKTRRAKVFVSEARPEDACGQAAQELRAIEVDAEFGENTHRVLEADMLVLSPGVPTDTPIVKLAMERQIPLRSEIEIAASLCEAPIVAITGTNGKTTTTMLVGEMFQRAGWKTLVAGNIGVPFASVVDEAKGEHTVVVLEVSSFQLDTIAQFRPKVSALLNITPDHLDRYPSYEAYIQAKYRIVENQKGHDTFVYNADDDAARTCAETVSFRALGFSLHHAMKQGAYLQDGIVMMRIGREREALIRREEINIPGPHNLMNVMAASLMARVMGVSYDTIRETLRTFKGAEHRLEFVRELDGVRYYNDSKATNVDSMYYALESFDAPLIVIAGGKDKGNNYEQVRASVERNVKAIIAIGKGADAIDTFFSAFKPVIRAGYSMEEAIRQAQQLASPGDVVLLSPACASFDMFNNYEHRGQVFKQLVHALQTSTN